MVADNRDYLDDESNSDYEDDNMNDLSDRNVSEGISYDNTGMGVN